MDYIEHLEEIFHFVCGMTVEQDAHRSYKGHRTGGLIQDQVRWGFEKPDIVVDDPV